MKFTQALVATAFAISASQALTVVQPREAPKVVQHEIRRKHVANPVLRDKLRARAGTVSATLQNDLTLYLMSVSIGTPSQSFTLHVDTGSSDLWVNSANSQLCQQNGNECSISGTYSANKSSTYSYLNSYFNITYADGSGATGDYATDTVSFGSATLKSQELGIGYQSTSPEGIIGIGYESNEAILQFNGARTYTNVPAALQQNGYTNTIAYSLWLDDQSANTGTILFGGIDTSKYSGSLTTLPIVPTYGRYAEFTIALTGLGYNGNTGSIGSGFSIAALLDSGSSLLYLPDEYVKTIYSMFGASYNSQEGAGIISCSQQSNTTTLDFTFSGVTIRVPMSEMVVQVESNGANSVCVLGVGPSGTNLAVLGDTFLRSAYVVYDLTNNEISLAQANYNGGSSNILEITSGGVPSATAAANAVSTVAAQETGGQRNGGITLSSTGKNAAATPPPAAAAALFGAVGAGLLAVI